MNRRKERFVETFVTIMFPVALLVACTTDTPDDHLASTATEYSARNVALEPVTELGTHAATLKMINQQKFNASKNNEKEKSSFQQVSQKQRLQEPNKSVFLFAKNQTALDIKDLEYLKQHAEFLIKNPQLTLTVSGHSDRSGNAAYNQKLSEKRARIVANILIKDGVPESQLITEGFGDTVPYGKAERMEQNRRVELQYSSAISNNNGLRKS